VIRRPPSSRNASDVFCSKFSEQSLEQSLKCCAKRRARLIRLAHHARDFFSLREPGQRFLELLDRRGSNRDGTNGMLGGSRIADLQPDGTVCGIKDEGVVNLGKVVIFGGKPEDRNRGRALLVKTRGQPSRSERLVDGVSGAREQSYLLAGDDRYRTGLSQEIQRSTFPVARAQSGYQRRSPVVGESDLARRSCIGLRVTR